MSESGKYTLLGALFGLCFPLGSLAFLWLSGQVPAAHGLSGVLVQAHAGCPLLYVIDTAPFFLGLFAWFAGVRQDRIRKFSEGLESQVAEKTESLLHALNEAQRANETIIHMAEHDALTDLLNRRRFQAELERWIQHAVRHQRAVAVLFIDLDWLKQINDTYGHPAGDSYLLKATETLHRGLRTTDYIARWGGDEFAVLLPETTAETAAGVANKLLALFNSTSVPVDGKQLPISASIGIALMPDHTASATELLIRADAAMYEAKQAGRGCWRMYSASSGEVKHVQEKASWEGRIRRALEADQFLLLYQPLVDLRDQKTHHYEALLRMEDRDGLLITPGMFLESAEQFDLSVSIDRMVIRKVAHKLSVLGDQEPESILSVNLSRKTLADAGFIGHVATVVERAGVDPRRIGFEIAERIVLEDPGRARRLAGEIRGAGHALILDDFSGGLGSFGQLRQLAPALLKLDAGLLCDVAGNDEMRRLVISLVSMAHELGIEVAAKSIEDPAVLEILGKLGIDYAQGFAVGRPLEVIEQVVRQKRRA